LITHSEPVVHAGLEAILSGHRDIEVSEQPHNPMADVVLADCEAGMRLALGGPALTLRVVIVTSDDREVSIRRALTGGVSGYLLLSTPPETIPQAIRAVFRGESAIDPRALTKIIASLTAASLTNRELEVLRLLTHGLRDKSIAEILGITTGTVKSHVKCVLAKLSASSRTQAAMIAQRRGLIVPESRPNEHSVARLPVAQPHSRPARNHRFV
jgi:DNA-binding NarL/FixJ family response regulator